MKIQLNLFGATLDKVQNAYHQNDENDEEKIDSSIEKKKYFCGSLDDLIAWEDKLPTCDNSQRDWGIPTGEILDCLKDEQEELIEFDSASDNEACGEAGSYIEIPGTLTSMEYLSKHKKFGLHKSYSQGSEGWGGVGGGGGGRGRDRFSIL